MCLIVRLVIKFAFVDDDCTEVDIIIIEKIIDQLTINMNISL